MAETSRSSRSARGAGPVRAHHADEGRRVVDLIRGLPAQRGASTSCTFAPQAASEPVRKVLAERDRQRRAQRAASTGDNLCVSEAYVDEGPTLKRFRPRAQGRAYRIRKRTQPHHGRRREP